MGAWVRLGIFGPLAASLLLGGGCRRDRGRDAGLAMLNPARDELLKPRELVARLGLAPGQVVADLGAGPGYLTLGLARAVGPNGRVIATDINAAALALLRRRAACAGLVNIETRLVRARDPGLERDSVDVALLCHVDAFLGDRAAWLARLEPALRQQGGRLVVIGYLPSRTPLMAAAERAGFRLVEENDRFLPAQFWLVFSRKPNDEMHGRLEGPK